MLPLAELHDRQRLRAAARRLFMPSAHEEWRWGEGGAVLEWQDGTTLLFTEELALIFRRLEPRPVTDFRAILYVLAACRGKVPDAARIGVLPEGDYRRTHELLTRLKSLAAVDPALLRSVEARAEMLDMILPPAAGRDAGEFPAAELLAVWREDAATEEVSFEDPRFDLRPLYALHRGLAEFSEDRLLLRLRTGLEELPAPADLPSQAPPSIRSLLEELRDDPEFGGMVRLAREIMAALKVPRALATPEDLPVGGWSDISNRGTPDRLLLTELAQDPLMLSVRVAQHEALYLRREPPARREEPPPALLIDTGLRMWGVPRVFAASVALAVAASRENAASSAGNASVWLTEAQSAVRAALQSREDLVRLLEQLHPGLDPLPALREFADLRQQPGRERSEAFFITHRDHLESAAFRTALRTEKIPPLFLATVDGDGRFALHRWEPQRGLKLLSQASLDLSRLLAAPRPLQQPGDLPAFLLQRPEPLSIPPRGEVLFSVTASDEAGGHSYAAMSDGSLMRWKGYETAMVVRKRPPGQVIHMHALGEAAVATVLMQDRQRDRPRVLLVRGTETEQIELEEIPRWLSVSSHGEYLFFVTGNSAVAARNVLTGAPAGAAVPVPHATQIYPGGILGFPDRKFAALGASDNALTLNLLPALPEGRITVAAWRSAERGRIEAMSTDGWHYYLSDAAWIPAWNTGSNLIGRPLQISTDGRHIRCPSTALREAHRMLVLDRRIANSIVKFERRLSCLSSIEIPRRNRRSNLSRAGVRDCGELCFQSAKGHILTVEARDGKFRIGARRQDPGDIRWAAFRELPHPELTLHEAVWPGGRAVLDRRGFIHLQGKHGNQPQVTLPLEDEFIAGWFSPQPLTGNGMAEALKALVKSFLSE